MNPSLIKDVAWTDESYVRGPIKAVILRFSGLNGTRDLKAQAELNELEWADRGGLSVLPYHSPWAWMSPDTVTFIDELVDALFLQHNLPSSTPIIATGGSMGGHGALTYTLKARHPIARCLATHPVCDLLYHYSERPDLPRTMHAAFRSYGDISALLEEHSPLHQAASLPRIPYLFTHGARDQAVSKAHHSDLLVRALRAAGHTDLTYLEFPDMYHGHPWTYEGLRATIDFVSAGIPA